MQALLHVINVSTLNKCTPPFWENFKVFTKFVLRYDTTTRCEKKDTGTCNVNNYIPRCEIK